MKAHRFGITIIAVASIAGVLGAGAGVTGNTPPWLDALNARSQALNDKHGLGSGRRELGAPVPPYLHALKRCPDREAPGLSAVSRPPHNPQHGNARVARER